MWKKTKHKHSNAWQELNVVSKINEMLEYTFATYAEELERSFKSQLLEIKRTNNCEPWMFYKGKIVDLRTLEIWKLNHTGDEKYKMFTLEFIKS